MTFKELLRTVYGLVMGTSVQYLKPKRHFFWPTGTRRIDDKSRSLRGYAAQARESI